MNQTSTLQRIPCGDGGYTGRPTLRRSGPRAEVKMGLAGNAIADADRGVS
jgi:hypothetical protein